MKETLTGFVRSAGAEVPVEATATGLSCGNPLAVAELKPGETVRQEAATLVVQQRLHVYVGRRGRKRCFGRSARLTRPGSRS